MGEKYIGGKSVGEKSLGEYRGRGDAGFRSPLLRFCDFLGWPISTNVAEVKPRPAFLFLKFSDAVQTVTKLVLFACHSA